MDTINDIDNVVNLTNERELKHQAERDEGIFFPVVEEPLEQHTTLKDRGFKAIRRTDTNEIIAVNGAAYKMVTNEDVIKTVEKALRKAKGIDLEGMYTKDATAYDGVVMRREYVLPAHKLEVSSGDVMDFRIAINNSYDGSSGFRMEYGAFRQVCSNGMVIGDKMATYNTRHTSGLTMDMVESRIVAGASLFASKSDQWKSWTQEEVTDEQAQAVIEKSGATAAQKETIMLYFHVEKSRLGATKWALYNALTYFSTHHPVSRNKANRSATITQREAAIAPAVRQIASLKVA